MRQRGRVVITDDLVDDPDPEARPAAQERVAGAFGGSKRGLEVGELAGILGAPIDEERCVQDAAALGLEPRLDPVELTRRVRARRRGTGEERLLVQQVGSQQRVVASEGERLVPAALAAQSGDASDPGPSSLGAVLHLPGVVEGVPGDAAGGVAGGPLAARERLAVGGLAQHLEHRSRREPRWPPVADRRLLELEADLAGVGAVGAR